THRSDAINARGYVEFRARQATAGCARGAADRGEYRQAAGAGTGSLTQIKVILSERAENSARPVAINHHSTASVLTVEGFIQMRSYFVPAIAIAMIMPAILSARSDDIPTLDVRPVCRGIASQSELEAGLQRTNFEECVKSEQATREQLK